MQRCIQQFAQIMWRNRGCHPHRNSLSAIGKQIRQTCWQQHRLICLPIIGWPEIHRIFIYALKKQLGNICHACLCVTHRSCIIAINISKIALPVHKRVAHRKRLREPHHRFINGTIPMRMEFTHHIPDHTRRFLISLLWVQLKLTHGK